ncbi:MMPL family transporter [Vibrio sp. Vb2880]|uniref:MMPL family transporter n=1 Tax=Vibrio sp. Vb2880 TaxID=2816076 RepID=UPI001A8F2770|nr:MMPL family transporter [Vibrio sp. Vb2880]MBO0212278.1 MMPL family transporter [Vibrio sp. Vb2880]
MPTVSPSRSAPSSRLALLWLALVLLAMALLVKQWAFSTSSPIETDIMKLLPQSRQNPLAQAAFDKVTDSMSDKVAFVLTGPDTTALFDAARTLESHLHQTREFSHVTGQIDATQQQAWGRYYFQHRFQFLTDTQRERLRHAPEQQVQHVIQALYNPFSGVTGQELASDPFLLFRDYLSHLNQLSTQFQLQQGFLTTQNAGQTYILMTAALTDSPYSLQAQQVVSQINQWQQTLTQQFNVEMAYTGVVFYADFGTRSAKSEISTIGSVSLLGIVLLVMLVFRSAAPLLLALLSVSVGLLVALATTTLIFGKVHLFSLVFGASLIGVSIDYAFHYLTDRLAAGRHWDSVAGLKHILAAITLGLITSLIGYLGLLVAPFPGLQQLALFSAIGLLAAYATVVSWYPLLARAPTPSRHLPALALLSRWLDWWQHRPLRIALPSTLLVLSAIALTQVHYDDDIRQLQAMPQALKQQEALVSQVTGMNSSQQMLVVSAADDEALMQKLEQLDATLRAWQQDQVLQGYQSLHHYVASQQRQQSDFALVEQLYQHHASQLTQRLKLAHQPTLSDPLQPVSLHDYLNASVSEPVRFLYLGRVGDAVASVVMLKGVEQADVIQQFANQDAQLAYLDKAAEISQLFGEYRGKVMELLAAALAGIALLLVWRYRWQHALRILFPCVIACMVGLAVTVMTGSALNLFNLLALVLVIGIGIDYTLFFAEQARSHSTLLAITLSATTTLLSFGLLALSQTHAIHSFGVTTLSGIFVAWLLSPLAIQPSHLSEHDA